jgi:septal ring factor EnvC (AmiA/AmiB activator)
MKIVKRALQTVSKELKALSKKTEKLMKVIDKLEKTQAAKQRKTTVKAKSTTKARRKKPVAKKAVVRKTPAKKGTAVTATDQVLKIIQRSKKGVDVPTLIKKTGFEDKQVRNIIFRAFNQRKIKRMGRGTYVAA